MPRGFFFLIFSVFLIFCSRYFKVLVYTGHKPDMLIESRTRHRKLEGSKVMLFSCDFHLLLLSFESY